MQKLLAICIVFVLFLNLFGFYIAFVFNQGEIKQEMLDKAGNANPASLHLLSLSKQEFVNLKWTSEGKEFTSNGRIFDVSKINYAGQVVQLYVADDVIENQLIENFVSLVRQNQQNEHTNSPLKILLSNLFSEFTITPISLFHSSFSLTIIANQYRDTLYHSFISERHSPPPDFSIS